MRLGILCIAPLALFIPHVSERVTTWLWSLFSSAADLMKEISLDYMDVSSRILGKTSLVNPGDRYGEPRCVLALSLLCVFHGLSCSTIFKFLDYTGLLSVDWLENLQTVKKRKWDGSRQESEADWEEL